jgi:hypothetical protein
MKTKDEAVYNALLVVLDAVEGIVKGSHDPSQEWADRTLAALEQARADLKETYTLGIEV